MGDPDNLRDEGTPSAETGISCLRAQFCQANYRPLVRLAALLIGDAVAAEAVAADALDTVAAAFRDGQSPADALAALQHEVVTRCRRSRYYRRVVRGHRRGSGDFEQLPVVLALRGLRASLREAIVLTHYLDLPEASAAAIAGISEASLRANLSTALRTMDSQVIVPCRDS